MGSHLGSNVPGLFRVLVVGCLLALGWVGWSVEGAAPAARPIRVVELAGSNVVFRAGSGVADPAYTNQVLNPGDRFKTGERSRAALLLRDMSVLRLKELTLVNIPPEETAKARFDVFQGLIYLFNRARPGTTEVNGPGVSAVVRGTEFTFEVTPEGESILRLMDGQVTLSNALGTLELSSGQAASARPGSAPALLPALRASPTQDLQWFLYYPALLQVRDLPFGPGEVELLSGVFEAYRAGDLRRAWDELGRVRIPDSPSFRLLRASLELSFGRVDAAGRLLEGIDGREVTGRIARALRAVLGSVRGDIPDAAGEAALQDLKRASTATEWMALSVLQQAARDLPSALVSARAAQRLAPDSGFVLARVAELEFGFGRRRAAREAALAAAALAPRHAEVQALLGFVAAAEGRMREAEGRFRSATTLDGGLANGWLGLGLCAIRQGEVAVGRQWLQVAAAMEPRRSVLRSYLAKAFDLENNDPKAAGELALAIELDPLDPTPWLYSAQINQNLGRLNRAIEAISRSTELNRNRAVYRSGLMLEQDNAVRLASQANMYRDVGMNEVAARRASASLSDDYTSASAHLFLAQSYLNADRINLRYEAARVGAFLTANLLSPGGAAPLSPGLSQQEYSALLEQEGLSGFMQGEYRSHGRWSGSGGMAATAGRLSLAADGYLLSDPGYRPNNRLETEAFSIQYRQQVGPSDVVWFQPFWSRSESGDLVEHYDPVQANPGLKVSEAQSPLFLAGWRHEWAPGIQTLALVTRLNNELETSNPFLAVNTLAPGGTGPVLRSILFNERSQLEFEAVSGELQQVIQSERFLTVAGVRYQSGEVNATSSLSLTSRGIPPPAFPGGEAVVSGRANRFSAYAYETMEVARFLSVTAGLSFESAEMPGNVRYAPLVVDEPGRRIDRLSPKVGLQLRPAPRTTLGLSYAPSLGGVGFDQSFRLEPTQVAGVNQAYRSLIPESVAGASAGERFDVIGAVLTHELATNTWLTLGADWLESDVRRGRGGYAGDFGPDGMRATILDEQMNFRERSVRLTLNRLLGRDVAVGMSYRLAHASLSSRLVNLPGNVGLEPRPTGLVPVTAYTDTALTHEGTGFLVVNHPSGIFFVGELVWVHQELSDSLEGLPTEDFVQGNVALGYRFYKRRAEVRVGVLNVTDTDFRIHPVHVSAPLPRERTVTVGMKLRF